MWGGGGGGGWLARGCVGVKSLQRSISLNHRPTNIPLTSPVSPLEPSPSTSRAALALLKSQPAHYAVVRLHQRVYLVRPEDVITVPRIKADPPLSVGSVIALTKVEEVGSRDYTLRVGGSGGAVNKIAGGHQVKGGLVRPLQSGLSSQARVVGRPPPTPSDPERTIKGTGNDLETDSVSLENDLVKVYATVLEHTRGKLVALFKKKRRKGYQRTIKIKPAWTKLRIDEIQM